MELTRSSSRISVSPPSSYSYGSIHTRHEESRKKLILLLNPGILGDDHRADTSTSGKCIEGFVDPAEVDLICRCGNGLLVHILVKMGYTDGIGIDLRARPTWETFPEATRERLQVHAYDPTTIDSTPPLIKPPSFLIGNHSDELTPWIPILAALSDSAFLSIPCCPWALDVKFTKPKGFHKREKTPAEEELQRKLEARGSGGATSLYATFLQWHFRQALACGFDAETEVLRIPSSRNWAIIGKSEPILPSA